VSKETYKRTLQKSNEIHDTDIHRSKETHKREAGDLKKYFRCLSTVTLGYL